MLPNPLKQQGREDEEPSNGFKLTFEKLLLAEFWYSSKEYLQSSEQVIKTLFPFPTLSVRQNFPQKPPPKQHIATD